MKILRTVTRQHFHFMHSHFHHYIHTKFWIVNGNGYCIKNYNLFAIFFYFLIFSTFTVNIHVLAIFCYQDFMFMIKVSFPCIELFFSSFIYVYFLLFENLCKVSTQNIYIYIYLIHQTISTVLTLLWFRTAHI